ncbi:MAG: ABC transporter substrate-binding protein [Eubacteriales bacterium]|nr:ABC transporter substrate-binding protein [Eubacteriales bacterium]MDD4105286.1 ABC transporter substrate-binding protein [Eubacteriales bacterium]
MKKLVAILLVLMLGLSAVGSLAESEKTNVVFWYSLGGTNADVIKAMTEEFNASQDKVFVDAQYQGEYDDAINKLKATSIGEALPFDIVQSYEIGSRFIIDSQKMLPIQEYIDKTGFDTSVIEPNLLAYYTIDGVINSMPFNCSTPLMYYNKTAFDEAGITEIPTTVDGVLEIAEKLTTYDAEGKIDRAGFLFSNYGWFFEQWTGKMGREYVNSGNGRESYATKVMFDENGAALDLFTMWKKIAESPYTYYIERGGTAQGRAAFVAGKTAIFLASTANLAGVLGNVGDAFEVGTAYFPYVNAQDKGGVSTGGGTLWLVNSGDEKKMDAAWEFITYMISPENQATWNASTGYFPINMLAHETETFKENITKYPQFQTALDQLHDSSPEYVGSLLSVFPEVRQYVEDVTEEVVLKGLAPEEAVEKLSNLANDAIEMYNLTNY